MAEIDWTASMQQTYEFYKVNGKTWLDEESIYTVKSCTINRDSSDETLENATFDADDLSGEFYIRVYLIVIQNGQSFPRIPLGTFLVQTSFNSFSGKKETLKIEAYSPLIELKEKHPPVGYALYQGNDILRTAIKSMKENLRAPVVSDVAATKTIERETGFVSEIEDTWLTFYTTLLSNAEHVISLDAMGNIMIKPTPDTASLQPVFTFNDDNSSILYPDITVDYDLYNVPNVVEVVVSDTAGYYVGRVVNDDEQSSISTVNRGREVVYRVTNPEELRTTQTTSQAGRMWIDEYAKILLRSLSTIEHTVTYTHGYCPVRVGDCVRLNYTRAGLIDVRAVVTSQSIQCIPGCPVSEKAVYTEKLWE